MSGNAVLLILLIVTNQGLNGSCRPLHGQRPSDIGVSQRGLLPPSGPSNCTYIPDRVDNNGNPCKIHR
ncbi:hypothetical protein SLEP1_g52726 [Rubroshorea leprosula]|uniref:Uncharacterized protein n=1 Tax=Rubroshorea leprosula TaxID=152421 RepID=A0AAV5M759_9ROSI|nr:hypothetical protein SLEP1_g52726 [Rubroshorea leprosula]